MGGGLAVAVGAGSLFLFRADPRAAVRNYHGWVCKQQRGLADGGHKEGSLLMRSNFAVTACQFSCSRNRPSFSCAVRSE